jgi:hypothetical protein
MTDLDKYLEDRIDKAALELQTATTPKARREAFDRLKQLHQRRTASRVAEMEREQGLR